MLFDKTINNIKRIKKLIEVLLRYGFEDVVENSRLKGLARRKPSALTREASLIYFEKSRWERIRFVIEELGPTFIKLGQMLSNRPDLLPEPLIREFEKLQDQVPPFDIQIARNIIEAETGKKIEDLFSYFDDTPIGSASIGQVHRARLLSGEDVVIKVQRPDARQQITVDLVLLREFIKLTEGYFLKNGILNPLEILDAFSKSMFTELDYLTEAQHLEQFRSLYKDVEKLHIPRPYREFCTNKVLVIEFVSGCKVTDVEIIRSWGLDPTLIAKRGIDIYLSMIFDFGIFHADPHPGNVLIKPDGTIALIDFGMVGKLSQQQKFAFAGVLISMANLNARRLAVNLRRLTIDHEIDDMRAFENDLNDLIQDFVVLDTGDMGFRELTGRIQKIAYKYRLKIPGTIFLILRTMALLENTAKKLDPDFNAFEAVKPYGLKIVAEQFSTKNIFAEIENAAFQSFSLLYNFPIEIRDFVKQLRKGRLNINYKLVDTDRFLKKADFLITSMVMALVLSALIIASAISYQVVSAPEVPTFLGLPYLSFGMLIMALGIGFVLFLFIVTHRNK
ncbi:MAG: ABC1 kinase family protein [Cyclobacteriaceae bacterium]